MIRVPFPYADIKPLDIAERNLLGIFSPSTFDPVKSEEELIKHAFLHPLDSESLCTRVRGCKKVLVVVDDYTRSTPVRSILPPLIAELTEGGIKKEQVVFLVALGTHRPMTREEMAAKLGKDIAEQYSVFNHDYANRSEHAFFGETKAGTPIFVNKLVEQADFVIGIGQIVPHRVSGFSGGGNIIQPGICGEITTGRTHWLAAQFTGREILGQIDNPVKREIESVAAKTGLQWIVNAIQDGSGKLVDAVAGDPVRAYRVGATRSREVYSSRLPAEADIVIADSHPFDSDLWVAYKGIYAAELAVKQGGVVILVSLCYAGVCPSHPGVLENGYQTYEEVNRQVQDGTIEKLTVAAHLVHVGRVIKERATGILVARGISKEETEQLGLIHAKEPQDALDIALALCGPDASVAVLQRGSEILPVIQPEDQ